MRAPRNVLLTLSLTGLLAGQLSLPAWAQAAPSVPVQVTAVLQGEDGTLDFVSVAAPDAGAGERLADRWENSSAVVAAEVDSVVRAVDLGARAVNDTHRSQQWGLDRLSAEAQWGGGDGSGVVVAVIDTGVDGAHPDLAGQVLAPLDLLTPGQSVAIDPNGHGTHVAGTVAAVAGNGRGVAGMAPGAVILPVRVLDADGAGLDSTVARGIVSAVDAGADVLNLSLGGPNDSGVLRAAVDYATGRGVVVVAAAGNQGPGSTVEYPAALPGVLAVGAITRTGATASFSSRGSWVDLVAPGADILSTWPDGRYAWSNGTSMAAPFVAAAAALVLSSTSGTVNRFTVAQQLIDAADDLGPTGRDDDTGHGLLDVTGVRAAMAPRPAAPAPAPAAPAPAPVAPAAPAASPTLSPSPQPVPTVPPASTTPVVPPAPGPVVDPVQPPASVVAVRHGARLSVSRGVVAPRQAVVLGVRALREDVGTPGLLLRVQMNTGSGWRTIRTTRSGAAGLTTFTLRPSRTAAYRAVVASGPEAGISDAATVVVARRR